MLIYLKRPSLVWALLFCVVLVNGSMAAPSVGHAGHHADHKGTTHSTGICAWLCAAGDNIETFAVQFTSDRRPIERTIAVPVADPVSLGLFSYFLRGPPVSRS